MQLDDYLRVMVKRWYVPVILLLMALAGAFLYNYISATRTAEGKLAVPLASFTAYDNIVNGRALAERVAARLNDGTTAEEIDNQMAGGFATGDRLLPQYGVSATDEDSARAQVIANIAMEESMVLFRETQEAQLEYIQTSYRAERDKAEEEALAAHEAFDRFQANNNAYGLPTRIAQQAQLVSELRLENGLATALEGSGAATASGELSGTQAELDRLLTLQPEYNSLKLAAKLLEDEINGLEAQIRSLELGGSGYDSAREAVQAELDTANSEYAEANTAVTTFLSANGISDLDAAIREQQQRVNDLILLDVTGGVETTIGQSLATAAAALERMRSLQPEYNRLARAVEDAEKILDIREEQDLFVVQSTLPTTNQVEVVEQAQLKSVFFWTAIRYAVAIFVAVFLSLLLVYVLCFFERIPPTLSNLEKALGKPVIGRIPKAASLGGRS
ncbi:MAG: hypothetical protein ABIP58_06780 [Dehalococcoidia bacterium]